MYTGIKEFAESRLLAVNQIIVNHVATRGEESNREIRHSAIAVRVEVCFFEIAKVKSQQSQFRKSIMRVLGVDIPRFLFFFLLRELRGTSCLRARKSVNEFHEW